MIISKPDVILSLTFSLLFAASVNAQSTMAINGPGQVLVGESFELQISGYFDPSGLLAGGIDLNWDPSLVVLDFVQIDVPVDPSFSCPGNATCPPATSSTTKIVWGDLCCAPIPPGAGTTLMATVGFTAIAADIASFSMQTYDGFTGGWFDPNFIQIPTPGFQGHTLSVQSVADIDNDGVTDSADNCLEIANPDQRDTDSDGLGNLCDTDLNNDCLTNFIDHEMLRQVFFLTDDDADFNNDGIVNLIDLRQMRLYFFAPPGPSGVPNICDTA